MTYLDFKLIQKYLIITFESYTAILKSCYGQLREEILISILLLDYKMKIYYYTLKLACNLIQK